MKRNRPIAVCLLTALPPGGWGALRGVVEGLPYAWRFVGPEDLAGTAKVGDWVNVEDLPPLLEPVVHFNQPFLENARRIHRWLMENPSTVCWVVGSAVPAFVALQSRASGGAHTGMRWLFTPVEAPREKPDPFPEGAMECFAARTTEEIFDAVVPDFAGAGERLGDWAKATVAPVPPTVPERPLISVCVAHFNYGAFLREQLDSLAAQTYPNTEVVVVDDGSADPASLEVWESLQDAYDGAVFRFIRREENKGLSVTRNEAIAAAKGDWIVICDADNRSEPNMVQRLWETAALTGADAVTCYNRHFEVDEACSEETREFFTPLGDCLAVGWLFNAFGDANALYRKDALRAAGGFRSPKGTTAEDWDLFARMIWRGATLRVVPEVLFNYRVHGASVMRTTAWERSVERVRAVYREQAAEIQPPRLREFWSFVMGELPGMHRWREEAARNWAETQRLRDGIEQARATHERATDRLREDLEEARSAAPVSWQAHKASVSAMSGEIEFLRDFFREQLAARDERLAALDERIAALDGQNAQIWRSREEMDSYYKAQIAARDEQNAQIWRSREEMDTYYKAQIAARDEQNAQIWRSREEMDSYYKAQIAARDEEVRRIRLAYEEAEARHREETGERGRELEAAYGTVAELNERLREFDEKLSLLWESRQSMDAYYQSVLQDRETAFVRARAELEWRRLPLWRRWRTPPPA
ncbi:MAG: glycosyltransferase [Opitutales bacterium]|nr:glycosyltransferase [Opitutales bacterium]